MTPEDKPAACGAHVVERLIAGNTKWLKIYSCFLSDVPLQTRH